MSPLAGPVRVRAVGAAFPSWRVRAADVAAAWGESGGKATMAVCADDEDVLTLSWDAAVRALAAAGLTADDVDGLWWGTTRPPYAEGPSLGTLATALDLSANVGGALLSGSSAAGLEALLAAADAVAAGSARVALVVAADAVVPGPGTAFERRAGAGAVAVVLSPDGGASLTGRAIVTEPVLDRYRGSAEPYTRDVYDPRLFREQTFLPSVSAIAATLGAAGAWSLPDPDGRLGSAVAKKLATPHAAKAVFDVAGDTGAAAALLGAYASLATPGTVAVVGYGGGRTIGVTLDVSAPVAGAGELMALLDAGRPATYADALRARGQLVAYGESVAMGIPPGSAGFVRGAREMLQLLGAKCVECGTVNLPPTIHPHCITCGAEKFTEVALARSGEVHTFVVNQTMPAPFVAPLPIAVIDLDDGSRVMLQVTGAAADLAIGDRVRLVLRRYALERGAPVYGYKALREA